MTCDLVEFHWKHTSQTENHSRVKLEKKVKIFSGALNFSICWGTNISLNIYIFYYINWFLRYFQISYTQWNTQVFCKSDFCCWNFCFWFHTINSTRSPMKLNTHRTEGNWSRNKFPILSFQTNILCWKEVPKSIRC